MVQDYFIENTKHAKQMGLEPEVRGMRLQSSMYAGNGVEVTDGLKPTATNLEAPDARRT